MSKEMRQKPIISIQPTASSPRLTRSPSHESMFGQDRTNALGLRVSFRGGVPDLRVPSPIPNERLLLTVPKGAGGGGTSSNGEGGGGGGDEEDEYDLIRSCEVLAKALGLQKSFSTSDILNLKVNSSSPPPAATGGKTMTTRSTSTAEPPLQRAFSEMQLMDAIPLAKLEASSRSLSTWVAVGDMSATSQLPSPQARVGTSAPSFTPADLIRSVNKKIRQTYMRKRLLSTYRALERMSQSGFDLEKVQRRKSGSGGVGSCSSKNLTQAPQPSGKEANKTLIVSPNEVDRDRGKPLSKFERNIMIFDWLHTLDAEAAATYDN